MRPRYWFTRETCDTEQPALRRVSAYLSPDDTRRIIAALGEKAVGLRSDAPHVSKTVQRIDARRNKTIVSLLTTDVYGPSLDDRKRQQAMLAAVTGL
jgi:hypothetical protein